MDKEARNEIMDEHLKYYQKIPNEFANDLREAIRECDKLARAWDRLEEVAQQGGTGFFSSGDWEHLRMTMKHILNPPPKDPLEELEEWVNQHCRYGISMAPHELLAEIRRLRGKK